jgi:oxygen-independent coproporphyrinogen-3 oxidase
LVVGKPKGNYIQCLMTEWWNRCEFLRGTDATSLYLGGGTPSLLDPMDIETFIDHLSNNGALVPDAEITIEVNPEDLIGDYVERLAKTRINRVSIGAQSLDDSILMKLGRKHRKNDALMAIKKLQWAGFKNISVDLIIGVMGEEEDAILTSLEEL